jgi:hypothetical protein
MVLHAYIHIYNHVRDSHALMIPDGMSPCSMMYHLHVLTDMNTYIHTYIHTYIRASRH